LGGITLLINYFVTFELTRGVGAIFSLTLCFFNGCFVSTADCTGLLFNEFNLFSFIVLVVVVFVVAVVVVDFLTLSKLLAFEVKFVLDGAVILFCKVDDCDLPNTELEEDIVERP
jgi:hypothetical protein